MFKDALGLLAAGAALAAMELAWVLVRGHGLFLSGSERRTYAFAALSVFPLLVGVLGFGLRACLRLDRRGLVGRVLAAFAATLLGGFGAWLLTAGRRVRDLSLRPLIVLGLALATGFICALILRGATAARVRRSPREIGLWSGACGVVAGSALVLDALVLPRGYPAFHHGLFVIGLVAAGLAGALWTPAPSGRTARALPWVVAGLVVFAPFAYLRLARHPNASYAVQQAAPWSSKLLGVLGKLAPREQGARTSDARPRPVAASSARGIDLRDSDVLLITVDALRADLLRAYGGSGSTPELDRLAAESVVFRRAYTPAPHTSYALASLLTAKFLKPVLELPGAPADHPTLPDLLRRYGYRTAAFYPPAIFFVDGARFDPLRSRGFGFEYRKEMYAPAATRVAQLEKYMGEVDPGHPLFVWVHLFEPHEPYEPPAELVREDTARARYEGEVVLCDRAIGQLVRSFRAQKPGATVIVTADHGEEFGDHGGSYHGSSVYDEQVRVPLLWSSPGRAVAASVEMPVELVDVGTTLLSAAGIPREARMRGDDLGPVLAGRQDAGPKLAFASVEERHMVTDGRLKAVCGAHELHCQLFDLVGDPKELHNLAAEREGETRRLREELEAFLSSVPRAEALALGEGKGVPEALARARLGAPGAGPDVVPLLGDARTSVRSAAARVLGELRVAAALPLLDRLRKSDPDAGVRAEAAIAALLLGATAAETDVAVLLTRREATSEGLSLAQRAGLALARPGRGEAVPPLAELALDASAGEVDRLRAVSALGTIGGESAVAPLVALLDDVRLREAAAEALGAVGGAQAAEALAGQLAREPYQPARRAEARALQRLGDKRTVPLVTRFLGTETSIPEGVRILIEQGALARASARGALLGDASVRRGSWRCEAEACAPEPGAEVVLPARGRGAEAARLTWLVSAPEAGARLVVDGETFELKAGEQQVSLPRDGFRQAARFALAVEGQASIVAVVVAPVRPEIEPPAPEPWDAGTN